MTNNSSAVPNDTSTTPTTGVTSPYAAAVATIQQALDTIAAAIPANPPTLDAAPLTFIRRRQGVKPELMDKAATAAETAPLLQGILDVPETRDTLAFNSAFLPIFERMDRIAQDLKLSIDSRRAKSGTAALNVYSAAKRMSEQGFGGKVLATHVAGMKPLVKRGLGRKKGAKGAKEPAPPATTSPKAPSAPVSTSAPVSSTTPVTPSAPATPAPAKQS